MRNERDEGNPTELRGAEQRNPELEGRIEADPDDVEAYAVYADWLQQQGDPLGEYIALHLEPEQTPAGKTAAARLLDQNARTWLGKLQGAPEEEAQLEWRHGLLHSARLSMEFEGDVTPAERLRALLNLPTARFLAQLVVGPNYVDDQNAYGDVIQALVQAGKRPSLRKLWIGCFENEPEISWTTVGDASELFALLPNLELLILKGGGIGLGEAIAHERLRTLTLETGGLPQAAARAVASAQLPALKSLEVWFGSSDYGGTSTFEDIAPLLRRTDLPHLFALRLMNSEFTDDIAFALANSPLLPQLKWADLSMGTLTDRGGEAILAAADRFRHLMGFKLSDNFLSAAMCQELARALPKVMVDDQKEPSGDGDAPRYYVSVGE